MGNFEPLKMRGGWLGSNPPSLSPPCPPPTKRNAVYTANIDDNDDDINLLKTRGSPRYTRLGSLRRHITSNRIPRQGTVLTDLQSASASRHQSRIIEPACQEPDNPSVALTNADSSAVRNSP